VQASGEAPQHQLLPSDIRASSCRAPSILGCMPVVQAGDIIDSGAVKVPAGEHILVNLCAKLCNLGAASLLSYVHSTELSNPCLCTRAGLVEAQLQWTCACCLASSEHTSYDAGWWLQRYRACFQCGLCHLVRLYSFRNCCCNSTSASNKQSHPCSCIPGTLCWLHAELWLNEPHQALPFSTSRTMRGAACCPPCHSQPS
jgi:hypothetical protein